jgi:hypothetical protein
MLNVDTLRKAGFNIRVHHLRDLLVYYGIGEDSRIQVVGSEFAPCGGETFIELTTPAGKFYLGQARCSWRDNYNKKLGTKIALARALHQLEQDDPNYTRDMMVVNTVATA